MSLTNVWNRMVRRPAVPRRHKAHRTPALSGRRFLPQIETLEQRTVPSLWTVTSPADSGDGSLRAMIAAAQNGDQIVFDPSLQGQTITLTSGQLAITKSLDIEGLGADQLAVSGNHASRVFSISGGVTVTLAGLTITDGRVGSGDGGGILNDSSTLSLANDVLSNNQALGAPGGPVNGGAIINRSGGTLTVTDSLFVHNQAIGGVANGNCAGGAINNNYFSSATVSRSTFMGNDPIGGDGGLGFARGGGIYNALGIPLTIESSVFTGNRAVGGNSGAGTVSGEAIGGGIMNADSVILVVNGSNFTHN